MEPAAYLKHQGRQDERGEDGDDSDDDKSFNEREGVLFHVSPLCQLHSITIAIKPHEGATDESAPNWCRFSRELRRVHAAAVMECARDRTVAGRLGNRRYRCAQASC